jgi:beta-glucanase (GH16 family)
MNHPMPSSPQIDCKTAAPQGKKTDWQLVWSDEFEKNGVPDPTKWAFDQGCDGGGNDELQCYTGPGKNAQVKNGVLIIEARKEEEQGKHYTSARLNSLGEANRTYGRIEVSAKLPAARGTWPAIWLLPLDRKTSKEVWPNMGELDIMEHVGHDPGVVHATAHMKDYNWMKGNQATAVQVVENPTSTFHTYALEWTAEKVEAFIDGKSYFTYNNPHTGNGSWPFDKKFQLILNVAVGGSWGGAKGVDDTQFPQRMEIKSVKVFEPVKGQ